ncbi:hypothetical protein ACE193_22800 [Bernardetia sp. OM2101]|uniref:hypothetical protein n=1 Tax=Bernardetia sp. OM2101 TaxID=3344876 RepID=UPI0035D00B00
MNTFQSQDFIINKLNNLVEKLPYIFVKYENDLEGSHFIEIKSSQDNTFDDFIDKFTLQLLTSFVSLFSNENIAFLNEGSLYEIENLTYSKKGKSFELTKNLSSKVENFAFPLQRIIKNYAPKFPEKINFSIKDNFSKYCEQYLLSVPLKDKSVSNSSAEEDFVLAA